MTSPGLLSLEEAQSRLLRLVTPLATERVDVEGSSAAIWPEPSRHGERSLPLIYPPWTGTR
ncbi:hypothetical protein ACFSHP_12380 [Novosphingobium panipatense]